MTDAMTLPEELLDFAYCPQWRIDELADFAAPEGWGPENRILRSYLRHLFRRVVQLARGAGGEHPCLVLEEGVACLDTGLYTPRYESIYAKFTPNRNPDKQPWFLQGFFKGSDPELTDLDRMPERVRFYDDTRDLVFDSTLEIRANVDHILGDEENVRRLPPELQDPARASMTRRLFDGAVREAARRAAANYMLAVPQYFNGKIQLLLPICLLGDEPDLALAIQREDGFYAARTCLTLEMAYNNARLVVRPEASWIVPE